MRKFYAFMPIYALKIALLRKSKKFGDEEIMDMDVFDYVDALKFRDSRCGCLEHHQSPPYNACLVYKNTIDTSPRHTDVSQVPLEVIEQINLLDVDWYRWFWVHHYLPPNFGPVKNWYIISDYAHFYKKEQTASLYIGFLINIKDLRVALYVTGFKDFIHGNESMIIEYAFDSYNDYLKAVNSTSEYALYLARKRKLISV